MISFRGQDTSAQLQKSAFFFLLPFFFTVESGSEGFCMSLVVPLGVHFYDLRLHSSPFLMLFFVHQAGFLPPPSFNVFACRLCPSSARPSDFFYAKRSNSFLPYIDNFFCVPILHERGRVFALLSPPPIIVRLDRSFFPGAQHFPFQKSPRILCRGRSRIFFLHERVPALKAILLRSPI